jgi:DNA polymerase V
MYFQVFTPKISHILTPYFSVPVPCGPGQSIEQGPEWISIDEYLRQGCPAGVAFLRVFGDSMQDAGIYDGDLLVVHRTDGARAGDVVIAEVNGEFTVKRLKEHSHGLYLVPANDAYPIRRVERSDTFGIWAVVTHVIHRFARAA